MLRDKRLDIRSRHAVLLIAVLRPIFRNLNSAKTGQTTSSNYEKVEVTYQRHHQSLVFGSLLSEVELIPLLKDRHLGNYSRRAHPAIFSHFKALLTTLSSGVSLITFWRSEVDSALSPSGDFWHLNMQKSHESVG